MRHDIGIGGIGHTLHCLEPHQQMKEIVLEPECANEIRNAIVCVHSITEPWVHVLYG